MFQAVLFYVAMVFAQNDTYDYVALRGLEKKETSLLADKMFARKDHSARSFENVVNIGAFGYEEYEWPCTSDMTAAYGYVLGQCSRGPNDEAYIYNWCETSEDESVVYFNVAEYPDTNCTEDELYNHTFWDYNTCDGVNSRKPFCTSSTQGWMNYDFDQHIE